MKINLRDYKIWCGAMSWISDPNLVAAVSNSNIVKFDNVIKSNNNAKALGVLATGSMNEHELEKALKELSQKTDQVYGVNLIGLSPHYDKLLQVCADYKVPIIIVGGAFIRADKIEQIKGIGAKVVGFATSLTIAKMLISNGIDAIIIEGSEAGGHVGSISTSVLVQEILFNLADQVPIIVAGGIGCGKMMQHYIQMGASAVQLGTRFVCANESPMHPKCKDLYIKKQAKDTVVVSAIDPVFSVIPVRVIKNKAVQEFYAKQREAIKLLEAKELDMHGAQMMIENFWSGSLRRGVLEADLEYGSLMAGQSISFVNELESVQEIMDKLLQEMEVHRMEGVC